MGDDISAGGGHVDANTDTGEADLVALQRIAATEGCLKRRDIGQVDASGGIDDGGFARGPERFVGEIGREDQRLSVVENTGVRDQRAHVSRGARRAGNPGTDSLG
ncbi:hypothetical protein D3C85_1504030 [compost metagenome]